MDDDEQAAYVRSLDEEEDDEDWVKDDEYTVANGERDNQGTVEDLRASFAEPAHPPSPDEENKGWVYDLMQDDPRYTMTHNTRHESFERLLHRSGYSVDFRDPSTRILHP